MTENKTNFATPNSSKLAQILLQLKEMDGVAGEPDAPGENTLHFSNTDETESDVLNENQDMMFQTIPVETCNCRKSKCLKLYCQCFAGKMTCNPQCRCVTCENTPDNSVVRTEAIKIILERNPNAFDSKFKPVSSLGAAVPVPAAASIATTSIASHKNGCRCRKSFCLKKYCECFQASVTCSAICTCLSCCNTGSNSVVPLMDSSAVTVKQSSSSSGLRNQDTHIIGGSSSAVSLKTNPFLEHVSVTVKNEQSVPSSTMLRGLCSPPLSTRNSSSLDGFLSHMMDNNFKGSGPSVADTLALSSSNSDQYPAESSSSSSAFNSTRPPLAPSSAAKRKRPDETADQRIPTGGAGPFTPGHSTPFLLDNEKRQATNLDRQFQEFGGGGVLTGMFPHGDGVQAHNVRSASPNSMSIATALSLFAANCFQHYNNSLNVPPPIVSSPPVTNVKGDILTSDMHTTPQSNASTGEDVGRRSIAMGSLATTSDALDTSTTSEDTDEDPQEYGRSSHTLVSSSQESVNNNKDDDIAV